MSLSLTGQQQPSAPECKSCDSSVGSELRRRVIANGSIQFVAQCLTCGRSASNPVSRAALRNTNLPPWDDELAARYDQSRTSERESEKSQWFAEHDRYLGTATWRAKRAAVMARAQGRCEGCGVKAATQVHHLTYEHWQDELLWELVAICAECHERVHSSRKVLVVGRRV